MSADVRLVLVGLIPTKLKVTVQLMLHETGVVVKVTGGRASLVTMKTTLTWSGTLVAISAVRSSEHVVPAVHCFAREKWWWAGKALLPTRSATPTVTVSVNVVVWSSRPGVVPVTVMVNEPAGVAGTVVMVSVVVVPATVGVTELELSMGVAPAGSPLTASITGATDPLVSVNVTVLEPEPP